ncbi:MAG: phage tail protein [Ktedonobacteraceae bacterium]
MDVNGTRFQLLLGFDDWSNCFEVDDAVEPPRTRILNQSWQASSSAEASPPWDTDHLQGSAWDSERAELTLRPLIFQFPTLGGKTLTQEQRRGAACDRNGRWYSLSDTGTEILLQQVGMTTSKHFWATSDESERPPTAGFGDFQPVSVPLHYLSGGQGANDLHMRGLTITEDQYLVVGVLEPAGILIFDLLSTSEPPRQLLWPSQVPFAPFDMTPRSGGGLWILDRTHHRYWALDRYFNVQRQEQAEMQVASAQVDIFHPLDQTARTLPAQTFPEGLPLSLASPLAASDPVAIEELTDDTVLILDNDPREPSSLIYHYRFGRQVGQPVPLVVVLNQHVAGMSRDVQLHAHDFAFVPVHSSDLLGQLYCVDEKGKQCYAFTLSQHNQQLALQAVPAFFPLRLYSGRGLVVSEQGVFYDMEHTWFPLLEQRRPRYTTTVTLCTPPAEPSSPVAEQNSLRPIFDGHSFDCVWHRLLLDACIPPETSVQVWSRAADQAENLTAVAWQPEPPFYRRSDGSELPFTPRLTLEERKEGYGTWELLFQAARGRYLQLKLVLSGNGRTTPRLRALRAYYPRFSYLDHYLPAVYRENAQSASFVERFLANFEGFFTTLEDKIEAMHMLFDARSVPPEALDWLASWFGIALDLAWNEHKKRLFIKHAMDFFQYSGTIRGLLIALQLTLEDNPSATIFTHHAGKKLTSANGIHIREKFRTRPTTAILSASTGTADDNVGNEDAVSPYNRETRWFPQQGGERLNHLYREFLRKQGLHTKGEDKFPLKVPADAALAAPWRQFAQEALGFIPTASEADLPLWQNFLARRYQQIDLLNAAYQKEYTSFSHIPLFVYLPQKSRPCLDWYQFEGIVLPLYRTAHQFTVVLPMPGTGKVADVQYQRELARRILKIEKPTHTIFDIQFYSAAFRIGAALLGEDTQIGWGSRTALTAASLTLGEGILSEGYLSSATTNGQLGAYTLGTEQLRG